MHELVDDLRTYLAGVDTDQGALAEVQSRKGDALKRADAETLTALADREAELVHRLRRRLGDRQVLLERARDLGHPAASVDELITALGDDGADLRDRLDETRATTVRLQRETWVHWMVAKRALGQYETLREMIAHHGRRAATYSPGAADSTGGAVLDASA